MGEIFSCKNELSRFLGPVRDSRFLGPVRDIGNFDFNHGLELSRCPREEQHQQHLWQHQHSRHLERPGAHNPTGLAQCLDPGCTRPARCPSNYCSKGCGVKLATSHIYEILPQPIQQWQQIACMEDEHGKRLLRQIQQEQHQARLHLQEMEQHFHELEGLIAHSKGHPPHKHKDSMEGDSEDTDLHIFCVSCSHPFNPTVSLRYMEHCYAKYKGQTSFSSKYRTHIEGATCLFCNIYNSEKTYCKQLQVLCPEHSQDQVLVDEVCGCLLVRDTFKPTGFCSIPKWKCHQYCWQKLCHAEVDPKHVPLWYKLDKLFEQECNVWPAMTNQAGLLALMLHQAIQHDPLTTQLCSDC
ncbi:LOW QUALITY PROTEIN: CXXC-type zinc finger protein 1 [Leptosomus discolor]